MAKQIEGQIVVVHYPRHPFGKFAGTYSIETRVGSENCDGDPGPLNGCTLDDPLTDDDKARFCTLELAWIDEGGRFEVDYVALRSRLRAGCGVRDEDLPGLTWPTILDILRPAEGDLPPLRPEIAHSPDFRSVRWYSTEYPFTPQQAEIVKVLWEAYECSTPDVDAALLLSNDFKGKTSAAKRVRDIFRNSTAWRTMIVPGGSKGTYRLAPPQ